MQKKVLLNTEHVKKKKRELKKNKILLIDKYLYAQYG